MRSDTPELPSHNSPTYLLENVGLFVIATGGTVDSAQFPNFSDMTSHYLGAKEIIFQQGFESFK